MNTNTFNHDVEPNGTHAKEIVMQFIARGKHDPTDHVISLWTNMAKSLLRDYTFKEILNVINHVYDTKKLYIYSFGFIVKTMTSALVELDAIRQKEIVAETMKEIASSLNVPREEARVDESSAERNRRKASGFGVQSRLRAQYSFDMYEGTE